MRRLADEIGIEAIERFHGEGFDFVVDDRAAGLPEATEDAFDDHLIAFTNFGLAEADHFQGSRLVLQQESVRRLSLAVRGQLDVGDFAGDDDILVVVLLRVGKQLGNFEKACVNL